MAIFSLREVKKLQVQNVADENFLSWPENATYGYYGGGNAPPYISTISRLDFSTETVSDPGNNLPTARNGLAATSSNSYGYFGGGITISTISRLDFSNETVSDPGKNFPTVRLNLAATSSNSYGYYGGGSTPTLTNTISRLDFSNETVSDPGNNLPTARRFFAGTSNNSYGYYAGGYISLDISTISRLDFSNETVSDPGNNLPTARRSLGSTSTNSYGYFGGGVTINTISRLDFSIETVSDPGNNLPTARYGLSASSTSSYGYYGGGTYISTISRLDFSNETVSDPGNNLPTARAIYNGAVSGGASLYRGKGFKTYGYFAGGDTFAFLNSTIVMRLDFSNETTSDPGNNLLIGRRYLGSVSSNFYGYFGGGFNSNPPATELNTISRLDFSNETLNDPSNTLLISGIYEGTSSNSYGYFTRASTFTTLSTIVRLDFSNDTIGNSINNLLEIKYHFGTTSSNSYGYFGGGKVSPFVFDNSTSTITRLDFSNETVSDPGNNLPSNRHSLGTVSNSSYGYFGGGFSGGPLPTSLPIISTITRLDFSNETVSDPGNNLDTARSNLEGTTSNFYGYFCGGQTPSSSNLISRLDFSDETISNPGNNLPLRVYNFAAVSNSN